MGMLPAAEGMPCLEIAEPPPTRPTVVPLRISGGFDPSEGAPRGFVYLGFTSRNCVGSCDEQGQDADRVVCWGGRARRGDRVRRCGVAATRLDRPEVVLVQRNTRAFARPRRSRQRRGALPVVPVGGSGCISGLNCGCIRYVTCPGTVRDRPPAPANIHPPNANAPAAPGPGGG
jgi:hypothetical protein